MTPDEILNVPYEDSALVTRYPGGLAWPTAWLRDRPIVEPVPEPAPKRPPYLMTSETATVQGIVQPIWPPEEGYVLYHVQVVGGVVWLVWSHAYNL